MDFTDSGDSDYFQGKTQASQEDDRILTALTHVGMALSLTGVVLTIISYLLLTCVCNNILLLNGFRFFFFFFFFFNKR